MPPSLASKSRPYPLEGAQCPSRVIFVLCPLPHTVPPTCVSSPALLGEKPGFKSRNTPQGARAAPSWVLSSPFPLSSSHVSPPEHPMFSPQNISCFPPRTCHVSPPEHPMFPPRISHVFYPEHPMFPPRTSHISPQNIPRFSHAVLGNTGACGMQWGQQHCRGELTPVPGCPSTPVSLSLPQVTSPWLRSRQLPRPCRSGRTAPSPPPSSGSSSTPPSWRCPGMPKR